MNAEPDRTGLRGILAPVTKLDRWLQVVLVVLVASSAVRYVDRHGLGSAGMLIVLGAAGLAAAYSTRTLRYHRPWWPTAWVAAMVLLWSVLTLVAPSFAWCAVPVAFAVLRVIPFRWALLTVPRPSWRKSSTGPARWPSGPGCPERSMTPSPKGSPASTSC